MENERAVVQVSVKGEMSIFTAATLRQELLDALDAGEAVDVDLSAVSEMDCAGLQLMVAAKAEAVARHKTLRFEGHSPTVVDLLELCHLSGQLGDPLLIRSPT